MFLRTYLGTVYFVRLRADWRHILAASLASNYFSTRLKDYPIRLAAQAFDPFSRCTQ